MASPVGSYARNSQKKQYLIFGEMIIFLLNFAYLSAVPSLFGKNPIEIIVDKIFVLDFAKIVSKQLINQANLKNIYHFSKYQILFLLPISCIAGKAKSMEKHFIY